MKDYIRVVACNVQMEMMVVISADLHCSDVLILRYQIVISKKRMIDKKMFISATIQNFHANIPYLRSFLIV
jgi:hypothetical protein